MKKTVLLFICAALLLECTNERTLPNAYELIERGGTGGLQPPVILRPERTASFRRTAAVGNSPVLLLGTFKGIYSEIALDCRNFKNAGLDSTAELLSAELRLYASAASDSELSLNVSVHPLTKAWDEATVRLDSLRCCIDAPLFTSDMNVRKSSWVDLSFQDLTFLASWIADNRNAAPNIKGLIIKSSGNGMVQFASSDAAVYAPTFRVIYKKADRIDTASVALSADASLLAFDGEPENRLEESPDLLRVGNGSGRRFLLRFDLSAIPKEATIHQALLTLHVDQEHSNTSVSGQMSVSVLAVSSDSTWENPSELSVYTSSTPPYDQATASSSTFSFDDAGSALGTPVLYVSRTVQRWLTGVWPNSGLLIYPTNEGLDWQEMAFFSGADNTLRAPELKVIYSLPGRDRFAQP